MAIRQLDDFLDDDRGAHSMKHPVAYLDTNIISAFCYNGGDVGALSRRLTTRDWWAAERLLEGRGLRTPLLVSPESIPQVRLGQQIRRR
jgi:hypothetical protein